MKTIAISSIFVLFTLVVGTALVPLAFADHAKASVSIPKGASAPGCEATNECYVPHEVTIDVGGEVTWSNDDTAAHTVTSGTPENGPDAAFDSSLFMAATTFSHKFDKAGTYHYFCMVHPWMVGSVIVQEAGAEEHTDEHTDEASHSGAMTDVKGASKDGSVQVEISTDAPKSGAASVLNVKFTDAAGKALAHVNYDITATQDGKQVLNDMGQHQHEGVGTHTTAALASDKPLDISVKLLGQGLPDKAASEWMGPKGEVVMFQVVPEFGTIAMMVLGVAIVSIVAVSARSKIMPRL